MAENGRVADEGKKSHCFVGNQVLLCHNDVFKKYSGTQWAHAKQTM